MIFWSVVVPIANYGCELLILNDKHLILIEEFQEYAGRRIQRFFNRSPKVSTFFALGWMRLERFIEVKKLLFMHNVLSLEDNEPVKIIFRERFMFFAVSLEDFRDNQFRSPVLDFLLTAETFGILDSVILMVTNERYLTKPMWKSIVWARAWELENVFLAIQARSHSSLNLLERMVGDFRHFP